MKKSSGGMDLHAGLKKSAPSCYDKSMSIPKTSSVNDGTRTAAAKSPKTLGGRVA